MIELDGGVLAAHDGSANAQRALDDAVRLAAALQTHVTVVRAWAIATAPRPRTASPGYVPPLEDFAASTLEALDADVADLRAAHPQVRIDTAVTHGNAAEQLIAASESADLIVVGRRGRGGFAQLVLGSVSDQVVRHAQCPVLVVNPDTRLAASPQAPRESELDAALASELKLDR
ncbi:universal stress protein [Aeromicrobium sp. CF3.5]|uniref:universal stress protein n=1 Tax=Aeromicrobium sp. CF3.5 TaxID=3373078 RepID=UPI003EE50373